MNTAERLQTQQLGVWTTILTWRAIKSPCVNMLYYLFMLKFWSGWWPNIWPIHSEPKTFLCTVRRVHSANEIHELPSARNVSLFIFPALDTTVALRQLPNGERRNTTDALAFALTTCANSVRVARMTLWTLVWRTLMVDWDTPSGALQLRDVIYCQPQTMKDVIELWKLMIATVSSYNQGLLIISP